MVAEPSAKKQKLASPSAAEDDAGYVADAAVKQEPSDDEDEDEDSATSVIAQFQSEDVRFRPRNPRLSGLRSKMLV